VDGDLDAGSRRRRLTSRFSPQVAIDASEDSRIRPVPGSADFRVIASALAASHTARKTSSYVPGTTRVSDFDIATGTVFTTKAALADKGQEFR
jgi:hypothetical protein